MTLVVGVDASEGSERALTWALSEARHRTEPVLLVHGWTIPAGANRTPPELVEALAEAAAMLVDRTVAGARALAPGLTIDGRVVPSAAAYALVEAVAEDDLLVVGSHGRGRIGRALLGSVADACLRMAPAPVVVIRPGAREHRGGPVVVGVDGSDASIAALQLGLREAAFRSAEVIALQAWHPPGGVGDLRAMAVLAGEDWEADARATLEAAVATVTGARCPLVRVERGPPATALLEAGRDASLVVVGSRGLGGIGAALLGSVSRRLVHEVTCPVIVVPDPRTT